MIDGWQVCFHLSFLFGGDSKLCPNLSGTGQSAAVELLGYRHKRLYLLVGLGIGIDIWLIFLQHSHPDGLLSAANAAPATNDRTATVATNEPDNNLIFFSICT